VLEGAEYHVETLNVACGGVRSGGPHGREALLRVLWSNLVYDQRWLHCRL